MTDSFVKAAYAAPELVELGSFEQMTQSTDFGANLDSFVAVHHPVKGHLS